jgi:hypothetical protein
LEYGLREQVNRYRDPRSGGKHCSTFLGQIAIGNASRRPHSADIAIGTKSPGARRSKRRLPGRAADAPRSMHVGSLVRTQENAGKRPMVELDPA